MNKAIQILIKAYKLLVSPLLGSHCRFYPNCSEYAYQAFESHSFFRAITMSLKRILRCHPWNAGGVDLAPK